MAKPTAAQKNSTSPLDAAFLQATGKATRGHEARWESSGDWSAVGRAMQALFQVDGALQLGRTRNGTQLTVTVFHNGKKTPQYFDTCSEALEYISLVGELAGAL
jgi:hypothetical protein